MTHDTGYIIKDIICFVLGLAYLVSIVGTLSYYVGVSYETHVFFLCAFLIGTFVVPPFVALLNEERASII